MRVDVRKMNVDSSQFRGMMESRESCMRMSDTEALKRREREERAQRAKEWVGFRRRNLMTQKNLAQMSGISRRTIQQIEKATISPRFNTQRQFLRFAAVFESGGMAAWLKESQSHYPTNLRRGNDYRSS